MNSKEIKISRDAFSLLENLLWEYAGRADAGQRARDLVIDFQKQVREDNDEE